MTNLDSILKQRHYFAGQGLYSQSYGFSSSQEWMWELDYKEAECQRINAFKLWCWRRLSGVPCTARRSKPVNPKGSQSLIFIGRTDCWSWNSSTFTPWWKELTHWKSPGCLERLKARGEGDDRGWDDWMASPTWGTWVWTSSGCGWWTGKPDVPQSMGFQRVRHDWATEMNWGIIEEAYWECY